MGRVQPATWPSSSPSSGYCSSQLWRWPLPYQPRTSSNSQQASPISLLSSRRSKLATSPPRSRAQVPSPSLLPPTRATLNSLLDPNNIKGLQSVLEYHVISGAAAKAYGFRGGVVRAEDLKAGRQVVETLEGDEVLITKINGSVTVQDAKVIQADVGATNGVVHVINGVLTVGMRLKCEDAETHCFTYGKGFKDCVACNAWDEDARTCVPYSGDPICPKGLECEAGVDEHSTPACEPPPPPPPPEPACKDLKVCLNQLSPGVDCMDLGCLFRIHHCRRATRNSSQIPYCDDHNPSQ